jgi:hypothetical protein
MNASLEQEQRVAVPAAPAAEPEIYWSLSDPPRAGKTWLDEIAEQDLELEHMPDHVEEVAPPRLNRWWVGAMVLGGLGLVAAAVAVAFLGGVPTRRVALQLRSTPAAAMVHVDGRRLGQTPLRADVRCRGWLTVSVHRPGYAGWHWSGVCPRAPMTLDARLLPYRWLTPEPR